LFIGKDAFCHCSALSSVVIPLSVETLSEMCFFGCHCLSGVTFECGSRLVQIGAYAFGQCSSLSSICIQSSVKTIFEKCFWQCHSLASVIFENESKLSLVEKDVFFDCRQLSSIWIAPSLQPLLRQYRSRLKIIRCEVEAAPSGEPGCSNSRQKTTRKTGKAHVEKKVGSKASRRHGTSP
jgi:hypothetical protein